MGGKTVGRPRNSAANPESSIFAPPEFPSYNSSSSSSSSADIFQAFLTNLTQRHSHSEINDSENERSNGSSIDSVFGSVPTRLEAEYAITAFQSFMMQGLSSSMSIIDRIQPILNQHDPRTLQSTGFQRVCEAFRLLQTVPSVQRMVVSISSDKAVWDAVMTNHEVQNFRDSLKQAEARRNQNRSDEEPDLVSVILKWVLDKMKLKILELIETLKSILSKSFESPQNEKKNTELRHGFEEMIVSTVLLSTITLMIVLVTRAYGA
ncbi:unnamed protein product [Amaranthus hypochondriacus]